MAVEAHRVWMNGAGRVGPLFSSAVLLSLLLSSLCCIEPEYWMPDYSITALDISRLCISDCTGMSNFIVFCRGCGMKLPLISTI